MISLLMIHGWAANGHIFSGLRRLLPEHWSIHTPHLLGHGNRPLVGDFSVQQAATEIAQTIEQPSFILGWSLGGAVALQLAHDYPEKIKGLILMNTFAKFLAEDGYDAGLKSSSLHKMLPFFEQNYTQTMRQFLELQLMHHAERETILAQVLPDVAQCGTPAALHGALNAALAFDARTWLPKMQQPNLLIYGDKDTITPPRMGEFLAQHLPNGVLEIVPKAAHAPFLSHADWCANRIQTWILEQN